jgi:Mrp family chromosome partitioning ATPase
MELFGTQARPSALPLFAALPGIADVVWGTVLRLADARVPASVLFAAPDQGAGTSVLACATAIGLAQHQRVPVCLIETNVARPALAGYLDLEPAGLSDVLDGRAELEDCLQQPRGCPGLFVLSAGTPRAPVSGEFTTARMTSLLARLEQRCHYLVLDAAPLLDHVESRLLLRHADGVLLVLRAESTRRNDAERAHDILVECGIPVLGSIFNAYRSKAHLAGNGRVHRSIERSVHVPAVVLPAPPRGEIATNGVHAVEPPVPGGNGSAAAHLHQVAILEQRIAKLMHQLEQAESDLRRIAALKDVDLGIASIHRNVQGLPSEDQVQEFKRSLLQEIFQANLELKTAMARHP